MDPDTTLNTLLDLFTGDTAPTTEAVREHVEALEQWHHKRGYLPHWPTHLDSGQHFAAMRVGTRVDRETGARLQLRSQCIALLARVQVAIEEESRSLYIAAVRALGGWAVRALDSEDQPPLQVGDVVRTNYGYEGVVVEENEEPDAEWLGAQMDNRMREVPAGTRWFKVFPFEGGSVSVPETLATRLRSMTADDFRKAYQGGNGFAKDTLEEVFPEFRTTPALPADWRCPTCKTHTGTPTKYGVTCANGHESL